MPSHIADPKTNPDSWWFGVPRKYFGFILITFAAGAIMAAFSDSIWSDTDLNQKVISGHQ
jgi:hypothetical protein